MLDECGHVRKAAHLPVGSRSRFEFEARERVRLQRTRGNAKGLQKMFAHEMRRLAHGLAHAEIHARLAKVPRQQLRMAIGKVQKADIAECRYVIQTLRSGRLSS